MVDLGEPELPEAVQRVLDSQTAEMRLSPRSVAEQAKRPTPVLRSVTSWMASIQMSGKERRKVSNHSRGPGRRDS
jgi:hypothetical protein